MFFTSIDQGLNKPLNRSGIAALEQLCLPLRCGKIEWLCGWGTKAVMIVMRGAVGPEVERLMGHCGGGEHYPGL